MIRVITFLLAMSASADQCTGITNPAPAPTCTGTLCKADAQAACNSDTTVSCVGQKMCYKWFCSGSASACSATCTDCVCPANGPRDNDGDGGVIFQTL